MAGDWTIFWDGECDFCAAALAVLLSLDRHRRVRPVKLQDPEAERALAAIPLAERLESAHLVAPDGHVLSGGRAMATYFRLVPGGGPVARLAERAPAVPERGYRWIADHRRMLSRPVPRAVKRFARGRVARRELPELPPAP